RLLCTVPSYEQFEFAVRLEAAWILARAGFHEVPSRHNSVALGTPESSSHAFRQQCKHVTFSRQKSSLAQWGRSQPVAWGLAKPPSTIACRSKSWPDASRWNYVENKRSQDGKFTNDKRTVSNGNCP
ncbi:MAG TPA: hypothetical protein VIM63_04420, partial [Rhodoferax sp.]